MKVRLVSLFLLIALVATVGTAAAGSERNFRAHLSGDEAGADTLGQGQAIFQFSKDGTQLHYKLIVANIENVTMAHIHVAPRGQQNGPPVLWLIPNGPPPQLIGGRSDGVLAERTVAAGDLVGPLADSETFDELKMAIVEGRAYVNVHTSQYPGGEIRGTIH